MQKPNKRLAGQTCIVTGANSGIGEAVAIPMGRDGANYAASKGAIVMLMKSICQEYAPQKVRCNSIAQEP